MSNIANFKRHTEVFVHTTCAFDSMSDDFNASIEPP